MENQLATYECDICGTKFRDADALAKHRKIHETGEKKELEQGTTPPMGGSDLPAGGPTL